MKKPEYKIGDVVLYKVFGGFVQQGIVRAATYFTEDSLYGEGWRYYVASRPQGGIVRHKEIISKA